MDPKLRLHIKGPFANLFWSFSAIDTQLQEDVNDTFGKEESKIDGTTMDQTTTIDQTEDTNDEAKTEINIYETTEDQEKDLNDTEATAKINEPTDVNIDVSTGGTRRVLVQSRKFPSQAGCYGNRRIARIIIQKYLIIW